MIDCSNDSNDQLIVDCTSLFCIIICMGVLKYYYIEEAEDLSLESPGIKVNYIFSRRIIEG
jgi:hypothetical protein